jgi:hypothetical protein
MRGQTLLQPAHFFDAPHSQVEHVNTLVAQFGIPVIPEETPRVMKPVGVEGAFRRRAEPHVVVRPGRRRPIRRIADALPDLGDPGFNQADFSRFSGGHILYRLADMFLAAALRPDLDHAVVLARRVAHQVPFVDGLGERVSQCKHPCPPGKPGWWE